MKSIGVLSTIKKEELSQIYRVSPFKDPDFNFSSSLSLEFDDTDPECYEIEITGSPIDIRFENTSSTPKYSIDEIPHQNSIDPFFRSYFKKS